MEAHIDAPLIPPPSLGLAITEAHRALVEYTGLLYSKRFLQRMPSGDGHTVILLPGFLGDDGYNAPLRKYLAGLGYEAVGWEQGRNLGPRDGLLEKTRDYLQEQADRSGGKVSLVGHSLGGIYARELAKEQPDCVRQVITLGSPFGEGRDSGSYPRRLFAALNPDEEIPIDQATLKEPPPVPTTAVYSKGDGVVNWLTCFQEGKHQLAQNIQVWGSHCGLTVNPMVWFLLAERLHQAEDAWAPFRSTSWRRLFYPKLSGAGAE